MIKKYNKVYHLHIPKTAGRFIKDNIIVPNTGIFYENNIKNYVGNSHANWDLNFIDDKTYIISSFRDPIKRTVSDYVHELVLDNSGNRIVEIGKSDGINRLSFMNWAKNNKDYISDFQSKNFYIDDPNKSHLDFNNFSFCLSKDNMNIVRDRINSINIFIKTENISYKKIVSKISSDLNIRISAIEHINDKNKYYNPESEYLYRSLSKEDIKYLENLNKNDYEIFYTDSLFL